MKILYPGRKGIALSLFDLISSDIDADRADYMLRDGQTSGIGFGNYDVDRLVDAMTIYEDKNDPKQKFYIRPKIKALSSVESFLIERFKLHKWLYFHKHVVFTDRILMLSLRSLIKANDYKNHPLKGLLTIENFHFSNYVSNDIPFDDVALISILRESRGIVSKFLKHSENHKGIRYTLSVYDKMLRILFDRENWSFAICKNVGEYVQLEEKIYNHLVIDRSQVSSSILNQYADILVHPIDSNEKHSEFQHTISANLSDDDFFIIETEKGFKPYELLKRAANKTSKFFLIDESSESHIPLTTISTLTRSLWDTWEREMHLFVYAIQLNSQVSQENRRSIYQDRIAEHIANLWKKDILIPGGDHD
ncbi:MAG: hypothetical protein HY955_01710 [Deltaproteobacteria bacterium]|nr:hypothetical protein [Deltaproteobacteria bacterium]